jgi:hypothetical protein
MGNFIVDDNLNTHNNSVANLLRGVGERVLYTDRNLTKCVQPLDGVFERSLDGRRRATYIKQVVSQVTGSEIDGT